MADKLDLVFKKAVARQYTGLNKAWYEELAGPSFKLSGQDIYVEPIPQIPPTENTSAIKVYNMFSLTKDTTIADNKAWLSIETSNRIYDFIPPRYGNGYSVRLFDGNNTELFTTHPSSWYFDYESGILTFDNNPSSYSLNVTVFKIIAYRYIGKTVNDLIKLDDTLGQLIISPSSII